MKGFINIKNNDNKCFLCCHINHLNSLNIHSERIAKADKNEFPVSKKNHSEIEQKNYICINVFCYKNDLAYPIYISNKKFENCMDSLLISDKNKPHYVYIKDFNRFMCNKPKNKNKKHFCKYCSQCFISENFLIEYKKTLEYKET